jgi:hypothetical protein
MPVPTPIWSGDFTFEIDDAAATCEMNCDCEDANDNLTLAEYREQMLVLTGFASIVANPPPGVELLFNTFLQNAQKFIYRKYPALRTRRFFRWSMAEGVRYYGMRDNDECSGAGDACVFNMEPYKNIEGAWVEDVNGTWLPLTCGIPGTFYTTVSQNGLPVRYEIRQCIEVFPGPNSDDYKLWIKGHFGLQTFAADTDKPTIDGQLVFMWALADALAYYGKPGAVQARSDAREYLGELVAGTHTGRRYVPGTQPMPPAIMPVLLPLPGE